MKCDKCGKEIEAGDEYFQVNTKDETLKHVCYECAKRLYKRREYDDSIEVLEGDAKNPEVCHVCWWCDEIHPESSMRLTNEDEFICQDCIDSLLSRGECVTLHYKC